MGGRVLTDTAGAPLPMFVDAERGAETTMVIVGRHA